MSILERIPLLNQLPEHIQLLVLNLLLLALVIILVWLLRTLVLRTMVMMFRGIATRMNNNLDSRILNTIERPMGILVLGIGIGIATAFFTFTPQIDTFMNSLARALVLAGIVFFVYNLVDLIGFSTNTVQRITGISVEERLLPFMRTVVKLFIVVMGALIIIQEFGYDVTGLIASFGVVGLALSLAAKDTAANVFGFTAIVSDNPFQVGDLIVMPDYTGHVEHVGVRSTRIRKLDQSIVIVPNSKLTDTAVTNWSRLIKRRMDFYIGLTYDTTTAQMREFLQRLKEMLKAHETVDPESVQVFFTHFGDNALQVRVIAYIFKSDWGEFTAEVQSINLAIMELVEALGLAFAFPSRSIYLESMPERTLHPLPDTLAATTSYLDTDDIGKSEAPYQDNPSASNEDFNEDDDDD